MRHLLLVLVMFSALNAGAGVVPRHRHQHVDDAAQVQRVDTAYEAVEAYSDTTTYDVGDDDSASSVNIPVKVNSVNPADYGDPFTFYNALWTVGAGGIIIAILLTLLFLVFIFVPIIIVVLLIRYLSNAITIGFCSERKIWNRITAMQNISRQNTKKCATTICGSVAYRMLPWDWDSCLCSGVGAQRPLWE